MLTLRPAKALQPLFARLHPDVRGMLGDSGSLTLAHGVGIVFSLISAVIIARAIEADGRGLYAWLVTASVLAGQFAVAGLDVLNRRLGHGLTQTNERHLPTLILLTLLGCGGLGLILALGLSYALPLLWGNPSNLALSPALSLIDTGLAVVTIPFVAINIALHMLIATRNDVTTLRRMMLWPRGVVLALALLLWLSGWLSVTTAMILNAVLVLVNFGLAIYSLKPYWRARPDSPTVGSILKNNRGWQVAWYAYVSGLAFLIMQKGDVLLIGHYLGATAAGHYSIAGIIADVLMAPAQIAGLLLAARVSVNTKQGMQRKHVLMIILLVMAVIGLGCLVAGLMAPWLVPWLFGASFAPSSMVLIWLIPAILLLSLFLLLNPMLATHAPGHILPLPCLVGAVVNIVLNIWLINDLGLLGACIASAAAYALAAGLAVVVLFHTNKTNGQLRENCESR